MVSRPISDKDSLRCRSLVGLAEKYLPLHSLLPGSALYLTAPPSLSLLCGAGIRMDGSGGGSSGRHSGPGVWPHLGRAPHGGGAAAQGERAVTP